MREGSYRHVYSQDTERVLGEVQCELGHRGVAMQLCLFTPFKGIYNFANFGNDDTLCTVVKCVSAYCPKLCAGVLVSEFICSLFE